ncbi:hypothetical protein F5141DRAFT_440203 [Pisolithus sp. B1]|nr:hypothetical protein F5141DRAFT_440203 [Pisolithus sp. B1]
MNLHTRLTLWLVVCHQMFATCTRFDVVTNVIPEVMERVTDPLSEVLDCSCGPVLLSVLSSMWSGLSHLLLNLREALPSLAEAFVRRLGFGI